MPRPKISKMFMIRLESLTRFIDTALLNISLAIM